MSHPTFPIHPHPHGLMSNRNQRRLRRQQAGATASQGGPIFVSPEDQFRMSLDTWHHHPPPPPILSRFSRQNKSQIFPPTAKPGNSLIQLYRYNYIPKASTKYFAPIAITDTIGTSKSHCYVVPVIRDLIEATIKGKG